MDVSVVIPNYQGREILPRTLAALMPSVFRSQIDVEVLVVDDASTDGGLDRVQREYPDVRLLRKSRNEGFGRTANLGAREATAPLVFFLNSDVEVREGFLEPLVQAMREPSRFAAASLILDGEDRVRAPNQVAPALKRSQIRGRGSDLTRAFRTGRLAALAPIPTFFGSGGSVMVCRDRFLQLGGFADVFLPFYYEDIDLCWRAWRRGWSSVIQPRSLVTHGKDGAIRNTQVGSRVKVIRKRNRFLLVWRNYIDPVAFRIDHLLALPLHLLGSPLRGDLSVLHGFLAALRRSRGMRAHRERERSEAVLGNKEIFERLWKAREQLLSSISAPDAGESRIL